MKKIFKRALSVMLAAAMILTTFFIFDPSGILPTAEAAVTATDPQYSDLYFIVPEAIYLAPRYNAYKSSTASTFQWYVNNSLDENGNLTLDTGESSTGKIAFKYPTATDVRISFEWQVEPGVPLSASASITYGDGMERVPASPGFRLGTMNGFATTMVMWGNSPQMDAGTSGVWIRWIATYVDTADGQEKQAEAYTYVYKPYVSPIAVGVRGKNTRGSNHWGSYISWISGVHGCAAVREGASFPKASTNHGLLPFSSSGSGIECCNLNLTLGQYFSIATSNEGPGGWFEGSSSALPDATGRSYAGTTDSHSSGDDYTINFAYSSTGRLTVDTSRYQDLNQIPNLSVGLMVTDDEDSNSGAAYFISNCYNHTDAFNADHSDYHYTKNDDDRAQYWDVLLGNDVIASQGAWNNLNAPEGEGIKFNERWRRDLSSATSGTWYVGTGYANRQAGDRIYDTAELRCQVNVFSRSALRDAYLYAIKSFPLNNTQLLGESESYRQFLELFRAVAKWLTKIDATYTATLGYSTPAQLANALRGKTDQIKSMSTTDHGRLEFRATQYNVKVYEENGRWKLSTVNGKTSAQTGSTYHRGARVEYTANTPNGYTFLGYFTDPTRPNPEAMTTAGNLTANQPGHLALDGDCVVEHAIGAINCTYYYLRKEYTIEYDLNGGELAAGATNPTNYNVESAAITLQNPTKTGYTFSGWTGTGLFAPTQTVTIPQGSTGNRTYKANWGAHSYTVHYNGNGATFGETADSEHTYGVPKELTENAFLRGATITYHYNDAEDPDDAYVEEIESSGFEFAGWNTAADGSGIGFTNRQTVVDLTTADSITLYAQWNAIQDVLPSPVWRGYGFVGWYSDPNFAPSSFVGAGGAAFVAETDIELYAKWEEHVYTIHYNGNGATGGATPNSVHHTGRWEPLTPNGFKREYTVTFDAQGGIVSPQSTLYRFRFLRWTQTPNNSRPYYNNNDEVKDLTTENSFELYAQWQAIDANVVPPEPTRAGYTFDGWYLDSNCTTQMPEPFVPTENTTLYARWTPSAYMITFDVKGGEAVAPIAYTTEMSSTLPRTSRTGYTFGNWRPTTSEGNWEMDRTYVVGTSVRGKYGSVTLEALWTPDEYVIDFDPNGGQNYPNNTNKKTFTIESTDTIGEPTRYGYNFQGWKVLETGGNWDTYDTIYPATESLTGKYGNVYLQAQWSKASYTITFDTDGGNAIAPLTYSIDSTEALAGATKNGFTFVGWKPETTSGSWDADMTYLPDVTRLTGKYGDVTLIAQWSLTGYMITFDEKGGTEIPNLYYTTQSTTTLAETTRTAFTFLGWKPKSTIGNWSASTVYPAGTSLAGMFGTVTLVAQWEAVEYTIHFDPNGGPNYPDPENPDNVMTYTTDSQNPIGAPERQGFTFEYWTVTETSGNWGEVGTTYKEGTLLTYKYGNVSLQAQWKSSGYTITYDLGGGRMAQGESNPTSYTVDNPDFHLLAPIWTGYEFVGWTGTDLPEQPDADGYYSIDVTIHQGSMGDREYTAHWRAVDYAIQYTLFGGALADGVTNPTSYTVETPRFTLNNPSRVGYDFAGWEGTDLDVPTPVVTINLGSTGDRNYRATWTEQVYTITCNLEGGTLAEGFENPTSYTINSALITLNNPSRAGYTFAGWTGTDVTDPMRVRIPRGSTGNKVYTAQWTPNGFTISYDLMGGALQDGKTNPEVYDITTPTFQLNNPAKEGYTFAGWTGSNGPDPETTVIIVVGSMGNKSYTANWDVIEYTLSYNLMNGQVAIANPVKYTIESDTFTLNNPTRAGYAFTGWTLPGESEPQMTVTIEQGSMGNRTYTAHWAVDTFTITYQLTGGALADGVTNPTFYTVETETFQLNDPEKAGYDFAGWTGSNGLVPQKPVYVEQGSIGDKNFTANWTPVEYTITYRQLFPNSTTPVLLEMENPATYTIETPTFALNTPENENYAFDGWTGSNGEELQPTVTIEQGTTGNLTFIAHWGTATEYSIEYFLNGGTEVKANPTKYTVNSVFQLNDPAKPGYTFTGWTGTGLPYTEENPGPDGKFSIGPIIANQTGNRYYTAHWDKNKYYVQFRSNGGSGSMSTMEYTYDTAAVMLTANQFVKTGATFLGWAETETATEPTYYDQQPVRNLTTVPDATVILYAVWEINVCTLTFDGGEYVTGGYVADMTDVLFGTTVTLPKPDDPRWPDFIKCDSVPGKAKRTFLGWTADSNSAVVYQPGADFLCQGDENFTAVWSANYYALDRLITQIENYRTNDRVPANENDELYMEYGEYADTLGSGGYYPWDNFDMTNVETALAAATDPENRDLPQTYTNRVNALRNNLQNALNNIVLKPVDKSVSVYCNYIDSGFYDEYGDAFYPSCDGEHSYQGLKDEIDTLYRNKDKASSMYTAESVEALHDILYGNGIDIVGIDTQVTNAQFKMPAQGLLEEYTDRLALAYHQTLVLKDADYTEFNKLFTEYLPDLYPGFGVTFQSLEEFFTQDSITELRNYYDEIMNSGYTFKNVQQWQLEDGGDVYMMMRDYIDALIPLDANYTDLFYEILGIPTGTEGFEYPAPNATGPYYPTWMEWARDNAGDISSQMDTEYLSARYTEASLMSLYRVLDAINWDLNKFEQDDVDGRTNITSYKNLLSSAIYGLRLRNYTITYKYNDGTDASFTTHGDYNYGDRIGEFPTTNPRRTDYVFRGWALDPDDTEPVTVEERVYGNMSLYAIWTSQFTITYDLNGGTLPAGLTNPTRYADSDPTITLNNPTRDGYDFAGWTGSNGDVPNTLVVIVTGSTGSKTYTANWSPIEYTISYELHGGTATNPVYYTIDDETFTLNNPTRDGYAFAGWIGDNGTTPQTEVKIVQGSMGDKSFEATWTASGFTITYVLNGGALEEGVTNPTTYTIDTPTFTLNNPVRNGCSFEGWTEFEGAEPQETFTIVKGSTGDRVFTANWRFTIYSIDYDLAGGALEDGVSNTEHYNVESPAFMLINPTKFGYDFAGWTGTGLEEPTIDVTIPTGSYGRREYTATWTATQYAINYELDGGTSENPAYHTIEDDAITLQAPVKNGYTFTGWTGSNGTEEQMSVTIPAHSTDTLSYTAHWTIDEYTITYVLAGGRANNPETYTIASRPITLENPTRRGYSFDGWTGTGIDEMTEEVTIPTGSTGDRTYTAHWTIVEYTIDYDLAEGALENGVTNPDSFTAETATFTLNNPVRTGYEFAGWTGTGLADPELVVTIEQGSISSREYTATWTPAEYSITYNLDGGSAVNPETYTIETKTFALQNPTKDGYTFLGWTGDNGTTPETMVLVEKGSYGDKIFTANWAINEYTISYTLDGGTAENPTAYTVETATFTLNAPTKRGYTFTGWTGSNGTEPQQTVTIVTGSIGNKNYTANWTLTDFTLTYDLDGGDAENPATYTVLSDTFSLNAPTKEGYDFAGWTGSNGTDPQKTVTIEQGSVGNRSYKANWDVVSYAISYDLDGGSATNPATYTIETETFTLNNPTKDGYTFAGWTGTGLDAATETVTIEQGTMGDKSFKATWTTVEFTISYDLADGTLAEANPETYTIESSAITLNNPTKDGYTFAGWTGTGLDAATETVTIPTGSTGNRAYTATWTAVEYAITCDLAGGTLAQANPDTYTIESSAITLNNPTREGYTFAGWTGTGLDAAAETVTIPTGSTGDKSYTATWTTVEYTISYDLADGTLAQANPAVYTVESDPITLQNPTREGYVFAGWLGTGLDSATETVTIQTGSTGERDYTATWTAVAYTITLDLDGGSATNPATYTVETETFTLNNPTRNGYVFAGWTASDADEPQMTVTIEKGTMGDKSFTAHWTTSGYTITYDLDGGTAANPESYTIETSTFRLKDPTKTGYIFAGWTGTGLDAQTDEVIIDKGSTGDRSYTAHWTPITYFVEYHSNTADDDSFTMEYTYDETYAMPANPFTKTGSAFQGWSATGTGDALAQIYNLTTENGGRVQLLAIWDEVDYTLTFDGNGATSGSVDDMGVKYGQKVSLPDGAELTLYSDDAQESRTFLGWRADGVDYEPGAEFECPASDVTFTAVWSANYYALDKLVATIEEYRDNDAVPANGNDPKYAAGGEFAETLGSDGLYPWNNYDMTAVETALAAAKADENQDLPVSMQNRVNALKNNLQQALDAIALLPVDYDAAAACGHSEEGFYDEYGDAYYPTCEGEHSYNALLATMDALFAASDADLMYTADSVAALRDVIYGNGIDIVGITTLVQNAALKRPAQGILEEYVDRMAQAYHTTLVLKDADYTNLEKLLTEYLPSLSGNADVTYQSLESFYTTDSIADLRTTYESIDRTYKNVQQPLLEAGGDVYETLKDAIDALVPLDADYTAVFYEILSIPTGTDGFSYPAADVTRPVYPTWMQWARDNAGDIASQMDTAYLAARYTETSVANLYRVLNDISWDLSLFEQNSVDGKDNIRSIKALLRSAIDGLKLRSYTVTFKMNDGTDASFTTQGDYNYGDRIGRFPETNPQRDEYVFKGWAADADSTEPVSVEERVYADTTLYAIWKLASEEIVELVAAEGSTTVIDDERGFIYGLDFNLLSENLEGQYLEVIGNGHLEFDTIAAGTGTTVKLVNDNTGAVDKEYQLVIFGDLNGDGMMNANDITQMRALSAGMVTYPADSANYFAADVNHDNLVNTTDTTVLRSAAAGLAEVTQVA